MKTMMQSASYMAQPLSEDELKKISGGSWTTFIGGLAASAGGALIRNWDDFKNGLGGRPEKAL